MATERQIEANRANAQKSTGPKTAHGKARSRANAWKHGLTANTLVIRGEETENFDELRDALMNSYDPKSPWEFELVERLVGIFWRLRRVPAYEAAIIDARQAELEEERSGTHFRSPYDYQHEVDEDENDADNDDDEELSAAEWSIFLGRILLRDAFGDGLGRLARHEASLVNTATKTLQMLLLLQEKREAKPVMLQSVALDDAA